MIIALIGKAGAGKSTAADRLAEAHGFARVRFASGLKAMLRAFLAARGADPARIEAMIEGDLKEAPVPELNGRSPRYFMQRLGNEFGRDLIDPALWVDAWRDAARAALAAGAPGIVVEDCRYPNEAAAVRALGGLIVRVDRPHGGKIVPSHASEEQELACDAHLRNDGTQDEFLSRVADLCVERLAAVG